MSENITFIISGKALEETKKFQEEHRCALPDRKPKHPALQRIMEKDPHYVGAIGGRFGYRFLPTSLGVVVKVECACGEERDVTDYDEW